MRLDEFELHNFVVEMRYPRAYRLWDDAGGIAEVIESIFDNVNLIRADPDALSFTAANRFKIEVRLERWVFADFGASDVNEILEEFRTLTKTITDALRVRILNRIGVRFDYRKAFPSAESVRNYLRAQRLVKTIGQKHFGVTPIHFEPHVHLQVQDEDRGYWLRILGHNQEISINSDLQLKSVKPIQAEEHAVKIDIDIYTVNPTELDAFRPGDWLKGAYRSVRRDTDRAISELTL